MFIYSAVCRFNPTHTLFNEPFTMKMTSMTPLCTSTRRIFIIHQTEQLPFGPFSHLESETEHFMLKDLDGIWAVSKAIEKHTRLHGALQSTFIPHHPWNYYHQHSHCLPHRFYNGHRDVVLMVNPCLVKGSSIFMELARRCPHYRFVALSGLGVQMYPELRAELEQFHNIE